jgi:hypothetical protein
MPIVRSHRANLNQTSAPHWPQTFKYGSCHSHRGPATHHTRSDQASPTLIVPSIACRLRRPQWAHRGLSSLGFSFRRRRSASRARQPVSALPRHTIVVFGFSRCGTTPTFSFQLLRATPRRFFEKFPGFIAFARPLASSGRSLRCCQLTFCCCAFESRHSSES